MMKYILGGILLNSVVACVPLDTEPYDRETDLSFWNKEGSALYALNACYPTLYSAEEVLYADAMTDNAYTKVQTGFNQSIGMVVTLLLILMLSLFGIVVMLEFVHVMN